MKLEELYAKYDEILHGLNVSSIDKFVFDLTDENSQNSLKSAFPGIESLLMPECGKYLVVATIVENPDCLVLLFPEQSDGNLSLKVFNTKTSGSIELTSPSPDNKVTIDNLDFADMEEITTRFNGFVFSADGGNSTNEVKNIGSFDVSNDEPVEIQNTIKDNEETEMTFKPIKEETDDIKWVEIPNTNAHGVTVTEDDTEGGDDPFAGEVPADGGEQTAQAEQPADGGETATPDASSQSDAPAPDGDATTEAPAEDTPANDTGTTIDDPKAKMRELLAYYTNYMTELVQDPNTSTELISATQEMIDSLINNMESADGIEEAKAEVEEAAKEDVTATEEPASTEEPANNANADGGEKVNEETDDEQEKMDAKIDAEIDDLHKDDWQDIAPATSDNILTPGEQGMAMMDDVDLTGVAPTEDEELAATTPDMNSPAPTSDVLDDTSLPSPDEEVSLMGDDDYDMVGPDGLPMDKFEGDVDTLTSAPCAKKIAWSPDYITSGVATSDDNAIVVPAVLGELGGYYSKVADEISKVPGKEDIAMKLQKIQILTQTITNEWNSIISEIGGAVPSSFDRSNMSTLEKDELDSVDAMGQVANDVMAGQEEEEEDDLKVMQEIQSFAEAFKHLI